jgi:hypothetical protein
MKSPSSEKVVQFLIDKGFTRGNAYLIVDCIRENLDINELANPDYDYSQIKEIADGMSKGIEYQLYANIEYSGAQMQVIKNALLAGQDVACILNPEYSAVLMKIILECNSINCDYRIFIDNPILIGHYNTILPYLVNNDIEDFSWVTAEMSDDDVKCICSAKESGIYREELLLLTGWSLQDRVNQLKLEEQDRALFSPERLRKFDIFSDFK